MTNGLEQDGYQLYGGQTILLSEWSVNDFFTFCHNSVPTLNKTSVILKKIMNFYSKRTILQI